MSLYYEAAALISESPQATDSLKLRVFSPKAKFKSPPAQLYALLVETHRWNLPLSQIVDKSQFLQHERKITPALALVLVHDVLFAKKGIAAPAGHALRIAVERHRIRLQGELSKLRVKLGHPSIAVWRTTLQNVSQGGEIGAAASCRRPRWVRINTLRTTLEQQLSTALLDYKQIYSLEEMMTDSTLSRYFYVDHTIPNLIALPAGTEVTSWPSYIDGALILQDKASCFPAYLLDPQPSDVVIDACAAPGNKTTHLAAMVCKDTNASSGKIYACERDKARSELLQRMVHLAGANKTTDILAQQDFMRLDPQHSSKGWASATSLLLDPSCSGSGIVGRDESVIWTLPVSSIQNNGIATKTSRKRKREHNGTQTQNPIQAEENEILLNEDDAKLQKRLQSLAAFQLKLILHAFTFPLAKRVTYSTCSEYSEENEEVVLKALASLEAKEQGWAILRREDQVEGMRNWPHRGVNISSEGLADTAVVTEACIRCIKSTSDGTQGFFVAAFRRDDRISARELYRGDRVGTAREYEEELEEEEWAGFADA